MVFELDSTIQNSMSVKKLLYGYFSYDDAIALTFLTEKSNCAKQNTNRQTNKQTKAKTETTLLTTFS